MIMWQRPTQTDTSSVILPELVDIYPQFTTSQKFIAKNLQRHIKLVNEYVRVWELKVSSNKTEKKILLEDLLNKNNSPL